MNRRGVIAATLLLAGILVGQTEKKLPFDPGLSRSPNGIPYVVDCSKPCVEKPTLTAKSWATYANLPVEIGGVDEDERPYLYIEGKREFCTQQRLIRAVRESSMKKAYKCEALRYLGVPCGITIFAPTKDAK